MTAHQVGTYRLRPATDTDARQITELVDAAYGHYVERIGGTPGPMTEDYERVIRNARVHVAERNGSIVGVLVLDVTREGFVINNVAVHPSERGIGLGRALLEFAEDEALRTGFDAIYLFTHEKMTENLALYSRIGYVEYDRRSQGDFSLVYMRKPVRRGRARAGESTEEEEPVARTHTSPTSPRDALGPPEDAAS